MASAEPPPPGHFNLLYFASASSFTKRDVEPLKAPMRLADLFGTLEHKYPGMGERVLRSCAVTVNLEYVDVAGSGEEAGRGETEEGRGRGQDGLVIREGDEVAIIPPVSSG